ncbi:MAG: hypothetical protein AB7G93_15510 [Bdellovibrionales bacterium]
MNKSSLLAFLFALASVGAAAQDATQTEGESTLKIEDAVDKKNEVPGDIDVEITNARMRAESGSQSKWSLSTKVSYTGGAVSRPFGTNRPNLSAEPGIQTETSADFALDARYRWTKNDSVTVGTSFGMMTPFQGDVSDNENQVNVFDPGIAYNRVGKMGPLQTNGSIGVYVGTSNESKDIDRQAQPYVSYTFLKSFQNGLTTGLSFSGAYNVYSTDPGEAEAAQYNAPEFYGGDKRTGWNFGIYPFAEYAFNDTFGLRTVFGYFNWRHPYGDDNTFRLLQTYVYQSVGVGISVTRNIYLYPNVQFVPDNIRSDFTNVALSATINVF